ncbi:hypothetical protein Tco_0000002 [Tanacetum coccineum]
MLSSPTLGALSYARADLLPSPKRIRIPETATDLEGCSEDSFEPYIERLDWELTLRMRVLSRLEINKCIAYADALRDRGFDVRVIVEAIDREETETGVRGLVEVRVDRVTYPVIADDILKPAQEGVVEVTYETLSDLSADMLERIRELERDNRRLRDMMDVASQRVARLQRRELHVQREIIQIRRFSFYDHMRIARVEACASRHLGYRS